MKAPSRTTAYKALLASLLLLLLHLNVVAQDEEGDTETITITADTAAPVSVDDAEEEEPPPPDTPVYRKVPDTTIKRLQNAKEFAYANDPAYWIKEKPEEPSGSWLDWLFAQPWFKYVVLALMIAILMYALVKIAISNRLLLFRSAPAAAAKEEEQDLLKRDNLHELITQAEQAGNLRLAVRYRYMKTLQDMERHHLIQLNAQSTNWDYVNKLGGHPLKKQFQLLTRVYEYVWYGEFEVNADQYGYVKTEFQKFENSL